MWNIVINLTNNSLFAIFNKRLSILTQQIITIEKCWRDQPSCNIYSSSKTSWPYHLRVLPELSYPRLHQLISSYINHPCWMVLFECLHKIIEPLWRSKLESALHWTPLYLLSNKLTVHISVPSHSRECQFSHPWVAFHLLDHLLSDNSLQKPGE